MLAEELSINARRALIDGSEGARPRVTIPDEVVAGYGDRPIDRRRVDVPTQSALFDTS
jgi:hypothetical protein